MFKMVGEWSDVFSVYAGRGWGGGAGDVVGGVGGLALLKPL